jgi:hypothetical protein
MTTMASHSSASVREHTPHVNPTTRTATIINALKRRAQAVLNDESIDAQSRAIIRYGLETNDPWLAELVRRANAGERIVDADGSVVDTLDFTQTQDTHDTEEANDDDSRTRTSEVGQTAEPDEHQSDRELDSRREDDSNREQHSDREKVEALADIICGAGEESAGALLVLMGQMENSDHPQAIVNTVKHFAFTRCGEFNLRGMVDTHIATLEGELLRGIIQPKSAFTTEMES